MPAGITCDCALCNIELRLLRDLSRTDSDASVELFSGPNDCVNIHPSQAYFPPENFACRCTFRSVAARALHHSRIDTRDYRKPSHPDIPSDAARDSSPRLGQQPGLSPEDMSQQALSFLLQYLRSQELQARQSHFAFAISRAVKRQLFEWASRENGKMRVMDHYDGEALTSLTFEEPFERYAFLRHFLHRCVTKGLLTDSELNLLIDLKLNGTNGEEFADFNGTSSNAVRQRLKRLLAKLRRLAR